jgi:hypothetical protein
MGWWLRETSWAVVGRRLLVEREGGVWRLVESYSVVLAVWLYT